MGNFSNDAGEDKAELQSNSKNNNKVETTQSFKESSATSLSCWFTNTDKPSSSPSSPLQFNKLIENISVDVVIVGGGISGLSTAYILSRSGKSVAVIEDGYIGSGETGHTTAHITHALDDRYFNLEKTFGTDGAIQAAESHTKAIDLIESVVDKEGIDCDFERLDGYLFMDSTDSKSTLDKELEATHKAGINTELIPNSPLTSFDTGPCLRFPNQAQFHPLKYLKGLSKAILNNNGKIFTETHAEEVYNDRVITTDGYRIEAKDIVIATNAPIVDKASKIYDKQIPYRTYAIGALVKKGAVPKALYWDTGDNNSKNIVQPYHYVRTQKLEYTHSIGIESVENKTYTKSNGSNDSLYELLIVGGEDHKTGNENDMEKRHKKLAEWAKNRFPIEGIIYRWSGQVMEPLDSLAFIGLNPMGNNESANKNNIYIATGDSGNGITHGTIAGILLSDLIAGKQNKWSDLYNPSRRTAGSTNQGNNNNDKENQTEDNPTTINKTQNKSFILSLSSEQGAIIEENPDNPIAVYKDKNGQVHAFSAKCTHLGCTLTWNPLEKSFDCPCHGSRFFNNGKVINGPANKELEKNKM